MKAVTIQFTDDEGKVVKTHVTCTLKSGMMDQIFEIAERAENMDKADVGIAEARQFFADLNGLIVEVFGHRFTLEELKKGAEQSEIMAVFEALCARITGEFQKN